MWIVCAALSIIFNVIGWILASKKKITTCWVSVSSLAFVALTLLMEYRMFLKKDIFNLPNVFTIRTEIQ